jgi:hypothetical protein
MTFERTDDVEAYVTALKPVDCVALGRNLAEVLIPHWESRPEQGGADKLDNIPQS